MWIIEFLRSVTCRGRSPQSESLSLHQLSLPSSFVLKVTRTKMAERESALGYTFLILQTLFVPIAEGVILGDCSIKWWVAVAFFETGVFPQAELRLIIAICSFISGWCSRKNHFWVHWLQLWYHIAYLKFFLERNPYDTTQCFFLFWGRHRNSAFDQLRVNYFIA